MAFTPFVCADAILGASTIRQITNSSHRGGQEIRKAMVSGGAVVSQVSGKATEEVTTLTSGDLAALVALNTSTFCSVGYAVASGTVTVPWKNRLLASGFAGALAHSAMTGTDCLVIPTSFEASQDADNASCTLEVHWISTDGTTQGATGTAGNSLAAQSFNAEFTLGPAYINASEINGVQSVKVNPGFTLVKGSEKGLVRPTWVSVQTVEPTIEITTFDVNGVVATINAFTAMTSANVYFRKRADAGVFTADITAEHIKFTFAGGLADTNSVEVSDNSNGSVTITLHGKTLTASAASAIP